jgi:hypothetical protein
MVKSGSSPPVDRCGVFVEHFKVNQGQNSVLLAFQLGPSRNNSLPIPYTIPTFTSLDTVFPNTVIFRGSKSSHTKQVSRAAPPEHHSTCNDDPCGESRIQTPQTRKTLDFRSRLRGPKGGGWLRIQTTDNKKANTSLNIMTVTCRCSICRGLTNAFVRAE